MTDLTAREAMLAERARQKAAHPECVTAQDLAPHMGVHEREYWTWCLERALRANTYVERRSDG